jgi:hypothetical protein
LGVFAQLGFFKVWQKRMITDTSVLEELQLEWQGVCKLKERITVLLNASFAAGGSVARLADYPHNLPFLAACGVFNNALIAIRDAGYFSSRLRTLGGLVKDSKNSLPWVDYALIEKIVDKRNNLAHGAVILPRRDCWLYIDTLETQLREWRALP